MSEVSANLGHLQTFITGAENIATRLGESIAPERVALQSFVDGAGSRIGPEAMALITRAEGVRDEITELATFVQLVRDALELADGEAVGGTVTISGAEMSELMQEAAENAGVDYEGVAAVDEVVEATVPVVGTVDADSGWVGDPVLTATGHFVIDEIDLPMPDRLVVLEWPRTYASTDDLDTGLGRGWYTWLNAAAVSSAHGVAITDQTGRTVLLGAEPGAPTQLVAADGSVRGFLANGEYVVRWGRRSPHPYETWRFAADDGRLIEVAGETIGATQFVHEQGRLVRLVHDGGRSVTLRWRGDRLIGLESSDGRSATFEIEGQRLRGVRSPGCSQQYRHDDQGRIAAVIDADGVTLVEVAFDERGRAIEQREHTGGGSRFEYESPRRTFVSDLVGVRRAGYLHDEQGRVIVATGEPLEPLTRRFDAVGRTVHQTNLDGTGFSMKVDEIEAHTDDLAAVVERETLTHTGEKVEVFEYDALERIRRYSRNGHDMSYSYRAESVLPCRVDAAGGWFVELVWERGRLVEVTDADGVTGRFDYDADGEIVLATDGVGNRTTFERHATGCPSAVHFADGAVLRTEMDDAGRPLAMIDASGGQITFEMSPAHRVTAVTDPTGGRVELRYDSSGLPVEIVDAAGHSIGVEVDGEHRPRTITLPDGSTREIERDVAGRVIGLHLTDRSAAGTRTREWSIDRNTRHNSVAYVTPGGRTTVFSARLGAVQRHLVRVGDIERSLVIDSVAESSTFVDADGSTWVTDIDRDLRTVTRLAPDATVATISYTPAGRIRSLVDAERTIEFGYDAAGRVVTRDEGSGPWRFERDPRGRVAALESPQGRRQEFAYDAVGRVTRSTLGDAITEQEFDLCGRLVRTMFPGGAHTTYEWGARGELLASTDRAGGVTRYEYDERRRMVAMIDPGDGRTTVEYAFDGLPAAVTDPAGHRRTLVYDADGNLLEEHDGERMLRYDLDGHGRRVGVASRTADENRLHDRIGFERDATGAVTSVFHDGVELDMAPVDPSRPDVDFADVHVTYDLDGLGLRTEAEGFVRMVRRDAVGRRVEVVDEFEGDASIRAIVRDDFGTVVAHADGSTTTSYGFHRSGFLASSDGDGGLSTWDYDSMGRLLVENGPTGRREFRYDAAHRLTDVVGFDGHARFTYDAAGRRTSARGAVDRTYEWDLTGLRAYRSAIGRIEFERDAYGRVTKVTTPAAVTDIVWSRTSGLPTPLTIGSDVVISDGASVAALRSPDGSVRPVPSLTSPWGELRGVEPFEVTWHPFHGVTVGGLIVLGARVYDIETRQFLSPDPQRSIVGMASSSWTYCYAANDPVNQLDPLGLAPLSNEEFERIQDRYTRTQWGNIAKVGIIVVGVALMPTGSGAAVIAAGVAIGAASAGGGELAKQVINNEFDIGQQGYRPGEIIKETVLGGALGGAGTWVGGTARMASLAGPGSSFVTRAPVNFASGVVESTVVETWDGLGLPGSDGSFDAEEIFWGGAASVVGGEISHPHFRDTTPSTPDVPPVNRAGVDPELPPPSVTPGPTTAGTPDATADIDVPDLAPPATTGDGPVWGLPSTPESVPDPSRPIKGNQDSGIFHEPGGQYYDRTVAEEWFATPEEAIEAGYRPPRR